MSKSIPIIVLILLFVGGTLAISAQNDTEMINQPVVDTDKSTVNKFTYKSLIIPATLISYGVLTRNSERLVQFDYDVRGFAQQRTNFTTQVDDFLQYTPSAAVFALDWCGVKAKNSFRDRFIVMATSALIMGGTVYITKTSTKVLRPDGSTRNSFPSGHTATAFTGAHVLFKEYKEVSPWIGVAGYAAATVTGMMRITNRRHWASDIITGAGVGIFSVELGYLLLPLFHSIFDINAKRSIVIVPSVGSGQMSIVMSCAF
ncbi:MAG: phosphatase PAP2 family protein [Cytophagaceae bacterium]|nr:phosphatase PAP2 family protein [Cytophagaceae bacterium]